MAEPVSFFSKLTISLTAILWFALALFAFFGWAVVGALAWWMMALVVLAGVLAGVLPFLLRWLVKGRDPVWNGKASFAAFALAGVLFVVGLVGLPVYYLAYWVDSGPTSIPLATLTNGKKTVVFQGMQHVGSEGFYKGVVFDLEKALTDGYTLFYEGVQPAPGQPELEAWFSRQVLGNTTDLNTGYKKLAESCGLTFQLTYFEPLLADKAIHPKKHVTADVTYLDLKNEYDRLMREDSTFAAAMNAQRQRAAKPMNDEDPMLQAMSFFNAADAAQKKVMGILCRGALALAMAPHPNQKISEPQKLILVYRNKALARMVAESPASKIYITYGAAHFPGFLADLKALDPAFAVASLSWSRGMAAPKDPNPPEDAPLLPLKH